MLLHISGVGGTVRQCNAEDNDVKGCTTQDISLPADKNRKIESPSGQNMLCSCFEDLCNNSPWLEWTKPTIRRPTTHRPTTRRPTTRRLITRRPTTRRSLTRKQAVVTELISEDDSRLTTESKLAAVTTESLHPTHVTLYSSDTINDSKGVPLPIDPEGISLTEKSMPTGRMGANILPANYNDHSTDKIQSNGVKTLNDDMVFLILLTLLIYIFWSS